MPFRRVKSLISHGHATMNEAGSLMDFIRAFVDDLADGFSVVFHVDSGAAKTLWNIVVKGKPGKFPVTVQVDPKYDTDPPEKADFVGGPYDGKIFKLTKDMRSQPSVTLEGGNIYTWNGYQFIYTGKSEVINPQENKE